MSLLTDHLVFSPKYRGKVLESEVVEAAKLSRKPAKNWILRLWTKLSLEKKALPKKYRFRQLKEWCPDHLWAPSCYHKTFRKSFIKNASQSVGHGWEVVEKYISGQKGYCYKTDTVPVVVVAEEKEKALKIGYMTLYAKLFMPPQK